MRVELLNIHKWFGKVHANDGITMDIPAGSIQGILGENGAGKSTLMKILSGFFHADEGTIRLDGKETRITSPADAIRQGIGMLHQDPLDFPPMRVIDNFLLGRSTGLFPDRSGAKRSLLDLQRQFDFSFDPESYVDTLTVGERQQLEILRLLSLGARVLILDEPTTGISALQKDKLFATLRKLVETGMTVIFVSHKLEEVEVLCHRVAVFRAGKLVGTAERPYSITDLVTMMFGKMVFLENRKNQTSEDCQVRLEDLAIEDNRLRISGLNLEMHCGEVIGLAGLEGSGQRQFLRTLAGLMNPVGGKILLGRNNLTGKPYKTFLKSGISYVPADRMYEGLISGLSLMDHFILAEKQEGFMINREKAQAVTRERIADFSIRGTPVSLVEELSGGNQQRSMLALMRTPINLLLMEHPTRGLDIESAIWIWNKLKERCRQGTTICFMSSDLEEVLHYSDRILVFFGGKVSHPINASTTSVDELGQLIGGKGF